MSRLDIPPVCNLAHRYGTVSFKDTVSKQFVDTTTVVAAITRCRFINLPVCVCICMYYVYVIFMIPINM